MGVVHVPASRSCSFAVREKTERLTRREFVSKSIGNRDVGERKGKETRTTKRRSNNFSSSSSPLAARIASMYPHSFVRSHSLSCFTNCVWNGTPEQVWNAIWNEPHFSTFAVAKRRGLSAVPLALCPLSARPFSASILSSTYSLFLPRRSGRIAE